MGGGRTSSLPYCLTFPNSLWSQVPICDGWVDWEKFAALLRFDSRFGRVLKPLSNQGPYKIGGPQKSRLKQSREHLHSFCPLLIDLRIVAVVLNNGCGSIVSIRLLPLAK